MDLEHIQNELFGAIDNARSALDSLGYVEVEYMRTDEFIYALEMLKCIAADVESLARPIRDREPISPETAERYRQMEVNVAKWMSAQRARAAL